MTKSDKITEELTAETVLIKLSERVIIANEVNAKNCGFKKMEYAPSSNLFFVTVFNPSTDEKPVYKIHHRSELHIILAFYNQYQI